MSPSWLGWVLGVLTPPSVVQGAFLLCAPLACPVQGSFPVSAWGCRGPSGRSPAAGALRASSWQGCAMARADSCTVATCPAGAGRVPSCPPCFPGHDLALLFLGFPTQFGGSAAMARVTRLGGLALPNANATAHEYTRGVRHCWRSRLGTRALLAEPCSGTGWGAEPGSPWRCVSRTTRCTKQKPQLLPAPRRGNDLPPLPSISGSLSCCLINMHYAQPIKAGAVLSLRIAA